MEDREIVELYLKRDESAINRTVEKYGRALRSAALRILGDENAAEECENDTYLAAWNSIPPHEPRDYLFAFLGRIARHLAIDECRKNAAEKRTALFTALTAELEECIPGGDGPESALQARELTDTINAFLASCGEERRNIFLRRYWFFDTVDEICARYGLSRSKVKTTLFRMRNALREHLKKEGYTI